MNQLPRLKIATPCPADWNKMIGDDKVRFCSQCNLHVYNLSAMTEPEALKILHNREGRLCARLYQRADGTTLTQDCPVGVRTALRRLTRFATAAVALMFVVPFARAQKVPIHLPEPIVHFETHEKKVEVHVLNLLGDPVREAIVELQDKTYNTISASRTDRHGNAHLPRPEDGTYVLIVRAPLLMTYSRVLAFNDTTIVNVEAYQTVFMGVLSSNDTVDLSRQLIPMPMRGIPDTSPRGPNSAR